MKKKTSIHLEHSNPLLLADATDFPPLRTKPFYVTKTTLGKLFLCAFYEYMHILDSSLPFYHLYKLQFWTGEGANHL